MSESSFWCVQTLDLTGIQASKLGSPHESSQSQVPSACDR